MFKQLRRWLATAPDSSARLTPWRGWLLIIPGAYVAAVMGSAFYGMPSRLPGIALGLPLLLDLERAAATLAALAAVSIFAWFTSRGYLPTVMGNILGYEVDRQHKLEQEVAQLDRRSELRIDRLEDSAHEYDNLLSKMGQEMLELRRRMGLLDGNPEP